MIPNKPPIYILVWLHSVLLFAYAMHGVQNPVQAFVSFLGFLVLLGITSIFHLIFWLATRNRPLKNHIRVPAYLLPVLIVVVMGLWLPPIPQPPNQRSPLDSPSTRYTMKMAIEDNYWIVKIYARSGTLLYEDTNSDFVGHLSVYWVWDDHDRLVC